MVRPGIVRSRPSAWLEGLTRWPTHSDDVESYEQPLPHPLPGRGRLSDTADVASYRNMIHIIRDRVQDMIKKGMTLEQVKAARPTMDFDRRYGSTTGAWTTDMFVEAVYRSLRKS